MLTARRRPRRLPEPRLLPLHLPRAPCRPRHPRRRLGRPRLRHRQIGVGARRSARAPVLVEHRARLSGGRVAPTAVRLSHAELLRSRAGAGWRRLRCALGIGAGRRRVTERVPPCAVTASISGVSRAPKAVSVMTWCLPVTSFVAWRDFGRSPTLSL